MKEEIKVPAMGESINEATVGAILKESGSSVKTDEEILELETDKVNQVLYAPAEGVLTLSVNVDEVVKIGDVIGFVDSEGKAAAPVEAPKKAAPEPEPPPPAPKKQEAPPAVTTTPVTGGVKRMDMEAFVADVKGGPAPEKPPPAPTPAPAPKPAPKARPPVSEGRESRKRMTKIRRVIAERLVEAQQTTAMLTTFNEVDMTAVMELRARYKESFLKKHDIKLGFMSFFVKACVSALEAFPGLNSYIDGDDIIERHYYDIGIAVSTARGLMVPVVRECDRLSLAQVEQAIANYGNKAREGGISVEDLQGGSFTITNGGIFGSMLSTPILNPPQSGILGMHNIVKRAVVVNDEIVIRPMMYLALSYDHRIVDGREAVSFLVHVKNALEDPSRLLLEL